MPPFPYPAEIPLTQGLPARVDTTGNQCLAPFSSAAWVWLAGVNGRAYNGWAWFRCRFDWDGHSPVELSLSADSRYRLFVNSTFGGDGPVRSWPEHWSFDRRDLTSALRPGANDIRVLVQHFGCNTFHTIAQEGGFIGELRVGGQVHAATDQSGWHVAPAPEYRANTPRIAVQLPAMEIFDARLANPAPAWGEPVPIVRPRWRGWRERDVVDPQVYTHPISALPNALSVARRDSVYAVPTMGLLHPLTRLVAVQMTRAFALAVEVDVAADTSSRWSLAGWDLWIDGQKISGPEVALTAGRHRVLVAVRDLFNDWVDIALGFPQGPGLTWARPDGASAGGPWLLLRNPDGNVVADDLLWLTHNAQDMQVARARWGEQARSWGASSADASAFAAVVAQSGEAMPNDALFFEDPDALFKSRSPLAPQQVEAVAAGGWLVQPAGGADVELHWDLAGQFCGYHEIELDAPAGTVVDISLIEYIRPDGVLQHTDRNRNCVRYITRDGRQRFTTRQRRSGRHLFLTLRGATGPVHLRKVVVQESRYPAECPVPFNCSDAMLTRVWKAADRTLQLSTDDVYTDCPLYEQTLWVGDARNLQLYGLAAYGAQDVSRRSLRLAAVSLDRLPMVGSQVPSGWDTIIPIWSFLWGMAVWEYYDYSGERDALEEFWPDVMKNLRGAAAQLNSEVLFDAPWWNLFEWADLDCDHRNVLYNSLFFIGAVEAAIKCGQVMEAHDDLPWLETLARRLRAAVAGRFDAERGLFPDAIRPDGTSIWTRTGVHTQFLAVLFGVAQKTAAQMLLDRVENNQGELVEMASPFAFQFWAEAFEKLGREDVVIRNLRDRFAPMVAIGDTLWEALPGSKTTPPDYPTRSHCHGWSSCPMDFFPRILLGLRQLESGGRTFVCSPQPHGLTWAEGVRMTPQGPIRVRWELRGSSCVVSVQAPEGVSVTLQSNTWLEAAQLNLVTA